MGKMNKILPTHIIFGLGKSGLSCARYFDRISQPYYLVDSRNLPPSQEQVDRLSYCKGTAFGTIDDSLLESCEQLVVSPGVALTTDFVTKAINAGIDVCGDVELFARICDKPIVAITGSNGKSTVTDLAEQLINAANIDCQKGGNIGLPVLDFLPEMSADIYVLELSSFQLDTTESLKAEVAVCLNITEDHMDRYPTFNDYVKSKQKIFNHAHYSIFNRDDQLTYPPSINSENTWSFSLVEPNENDEKISFLKKEDKGSQLVVTNQSILLAQQLNVTGKHNWSNVLACLTILKCLDIEITEQILNKLIAYKGLKHRFQLVSRKNKCEWINDSKATNVGATVAALNSLDLSANQKVTLIAGGDSKQSDLTPLIEPINNIVSHLILMGVDAQKIAQLPIQTNPYFVDDMNQAVTKANELIEPNDIVLLSPACASLDMYSSFEARGDAFIDAVRECA